MLTKFNQIWLHIFLDYVYVKGSTRVLVLEYNVSNKALFEHNDKVNENYVVSYHIRVSSLKSRPLSFTWSIRMW